MDLWKKHWNMAETKIPAENLLMQLFLSHDVFAILTLKDTPRREWGAAIKSDKKQTRTMTYTNVSRSVFSRIHCLTRTIVERREGKWSVGNSCYLNSLNASWRRAHSSQASHKIIARFLGPIHVCFALQIGTLGARCGVTTFAVRALL